MHRSVAGFIWQAGGFQLTSGVEHHSNGRRMRLCRMSLRPSNKARHDCDGQTWEAIRNSAHEAMFFNEADNAANLDNQNGGFTVFGNIVGTAGLAVMDAIAAVPVPSPGSIWPRRSIRFPFRITPRVARCSSPRT